MVNNRLNSDEFINEVETKEKREFGRGSAIAKARLSWIDADTMAPINNSEVFPDTDRSTDNDADE